MIGEAAQIEALVTDWKTIPVEHIGEGIERQMVIGQNIMICRLKFAPFTVTAEHSHVHEQMTLVMQGKVKFSWAAKHASFRRETFCIFHQIIGTAQQCLMKKWF